MGREPTGAGGSGGIGRSGLMAAGGGVSIPKAGFGAGVGLTNGFGEIGGEATGCVGTGGTVGTGAGAEA